MKAIHKIYGNSSAGQVHMRVLDAKEAAADGANRPLVCLHAAPYSGLYFSTVMPLLNAARTVIAPDYPGYGGSDPVPNGAPDIADYARATLESLASLGFDPPYDVLGFHTGCLVGVEMRRLASDSIEHLLLCDVPYFNAETQAELRVKMGKALPVTAELSSLSAAWDFDVSSRLEAAGLDRSLQLFVEHMRAAPDDHLAFVAAFSYDCVTRFAELAGRTTVIATESGLKEASKTAAAAIAGATLVTADDIQGAVFEAGARRIAQYINDSLDGGG
ncbi:MAG: alpha/beta hydrolase [Pseudomonadota bacterium]